jgi:hypothetical protein
MRLNRQDHVQHILYATKPPKGSEFNPKAIRVTLQIPAYLHHTRTKAYDLAQSLQNTKPHAEIKVAGDNVYMNNELIHDPVQPLTPDTKIYLNKADMWKAIASRLRFFTGDIISENKSDFQMYNTEVSTIQEACLAFEAIGLESKASSSTHLVSAYWLYDGTYGYQDDRDHGMGKRLLSVMQESGLMNTICFL